MGGPGNLTHYLDVTSAIFYQLYYKEPLSGCSVHFITLSTSGCLRENTLHGQKYVDKPFKLVDSAISAMLVADRCIKLSTQPNNLQSPRAQ